MYDQTYMKDIYTIGYYVYIYGFVIEDIRANRMIRCNEIPQLVALEMQLE